MHRLTSELLALVAELRTGWMEERAHLVRRVAALEAERTSWAAGER
jgi:hypothetical protein